MSNASGKFIVHACVERNAKLLYEYLDINESVCVWALQSLEELEDPDKKEVHFSLLTSETKSLAQALRSIGTGLTFKDPPHICVQFILVPCHDGDDMRDPTDIVLSLEEVKERPFISYSIPIISDDKGVLRAAPMKKWIKRVKQDRLVTKRNFESADNLFIRRLMKAVKELMESNDAADLNEKQGNVVMMEKKQFDASKGFWETWE